VEALKEKGRKSGPRLHRPQGGEKRAGWPWRTKARRKKVLRREKRGQGRHTLLFLPEKGKKNGGTGSTMPIESEKREKRTEEDAEAESGGGKERGPRG